MTYSAVPSKATGDTVSAGDWGTYLKDNLADHEARITANSYSGCRLTRDTDQNISDTTLTPVVWTHEIVDQGGWYPGSGSTVTVPAAALPPGYTTVIVSMSVQIWWDSDADGTRSVAFYKNGVEFARQKMVAGYTGIFGQVVAPPDIDAEPTDTFQVQVIHSAGGTLALVGSSNLLALSIRREGYF